MSKQSRWVMQSTGVWMDGRIRVHAAHQSSNEKRWLFFLMESFSTTWEVLSMIPTSSQRDLRENHCCWSWILISGHTEAQTSPCLWNNLHSVRNTSISTQTMGWSWLESVGYISASLLTLVISLVIDTKEGSFLGKVHHHNLQHKGRLGLSASHWLSKNMVLLSLAILVYTHNGLSPFSSWGRSQNHRLYWVGRDVKGHLVPCWVVCLVVKGVRSPVHSGWRQFSPICLYGCRRLKAAFSLHQHSQFSKLWGYPKDWYESRFPVCNSNFCCWKRKKCQFEINHQNSCNILPVW